MRIYRIQNIEFRFLRKEALVQVYIGDDIIDSLDREAVGDLQGFLGDCKYDMPEIKTKEKP